MEMILVVDDEEVIRSLVVEMLEDAGYHAVGAHHGEEGLRMVKRELPDLVLCDLMMPIMDGRAFCRAMQSDPRYQAIPLILMSAGGAPLAHTDCPYAAFLNKPFAIDAVLHTVDGLLHTSGTGRTGDANRP